MLKAEIKERVVVTKSTAKNLNVFQMDDHLAKEEFGRFGKELLEKLGLHDEDA